MTSRRASVLFVLMLIAGLQPAWAAESSPAGIEVSVDPRVELLTVVQTLAGGRAASRLTRLDVDDRDAVEQFYRSVRDHEAVQRLRTLAEGGFTYDAPVRAVLSFGPPPDLAPIGPPDPNAVHRAGGQESFDAFIASLRDFARRSNHAGFMSRRASFHQRMIADTTARLGAIDASVVEAYYGVSGHRYRIVLSPLLHPGGYGPSVPNDDGTLTIYGVIGPHAIEDGRPTFGTPDDLRQLVWHEFSHSFVNPLVDQHGEVVDGCAVLFEPMRSMMERQAYRTWRICVYEHIVRAVTCRLTARELGTEAGNAAIDGERRRGFSYMPMLCAELERYEAHREQFPRFETFMPELLTVFTDAAAKKAAQNPGGGAAPDGPAAPPRVTSSIPKAGAVDVDPSVTEIRVDFDQDMNTRSYSWAKRDNESFPTVTATPRWITPRTCILDVQLQPGRTYWIGINTSGLTGFQSQNKTPATSYAIEFTTTPQ